MRCAHVRDLIDAVPFVDYSRTHLDAAWEHARQCDTCGPALAASRNLTASLIALAHPAPRRDLAADVLARLEATHTRGAAPAGAEVPQAGARARTPAWPAWATVLGSAAAAFAIALSLLAGGAAPIAVASAVAGGRMAGSLAMPATMPQALGLIAGLALYAAGLFAPRRPRAGGATLPP